MYSLLILKLDLVISASSAALQVIDRQVYKAAMQKTVEKVMHGHARSTDARFLIREGSKIQKLLMLYVERLTDKL